MFSFPPTTFSPMFLATFRSIYFTPNVLVKVNKDGRVASPAKVWIIDYNWAGRVGSAEYPWHRNTKPRGPITKEHDLWMIDNNIFCSDSS